MGFPACFNCRKAFLDKANDSKRQSIALNKENRTDGSF